MDNDKERTPVFTAKNVIKTYQMGEIEIHALCGLDIDLYKNEIVVIVGPSGSGKSTFVNILGGLDTPTSGDVYFHNQLLTGETETELTQYRRKHIGFVFQSYNLIPNLTARENVQIVTDISSNPMDATRALTLVGLANRLEHFPSQLSGGEQQRIAIARAIAKNPAVLLCDEPTGALDCQTGKIVLDAIVRVNQELGTLVVVITHNIVITHIADRVLYMADGLISRIEKNKTKLPASELEW